MDSKEHNCLITFLIHEEYPREILDLYPSEACRYAKKNYRRKASSFRVHGGETLFKVSSLNTNLP